MRIGIHFYTTIFFVVPAVVFHSLPRLCGGIPDKNRDFAIQFFVQAIFHFSTSLCHSLVPHTIGDLSLRFKLKKHQPRMIRHFYTMYHCETPPFHNTRLFKKSLYLLLKGEFKRFTELPGIVSIWLIC